MGQFQSRDLNFLNMQVSKLNAIRGRRITETGVGWGVVPGAAGELT